MGNKTTFVNLIKQFKIEIPRIQRDYVQGRAITSEQIEKRDEFVNNLISALENINKACVLDFVYGFVQGEKESKTFIPLDGQQRLTSLFLLHWYLLYLIHTKSEKDPFEKESEYLGLIKGRFLYSNRTSSTEFCERITSFEEGEFNFGVKGPIDNVLKQQAWFDDEWIFDPTIETMLIMLQEYEKELEGRGISQLAEMTLRLFTEEAIYFDRLDLEELHQGESLYVKMNARGKKLTPFENWKSKFTKMLDEYYHDEEFKTGDIKRCKTLVFKDYFSYSIEHDWNNFFWRFVTKGFKMDTLADVVESPYPTVDRAFTNFLKFLHSLLFFQQRNEKDAKATDFQWTFAQNLETYGKGKKDNLVLLFQCLDFIAAVPDYYFSDIFYTKKDNLQVENTHKVRLYKDATNLLEQAIGYYEDPESHEVIDNRDDSSRFDLTSAFLLYAILIHAAPLYCKDRVTPTVDDSLRFYVRNCRNYLETKNQFLHAKVSLSPDIRITQSAEVIKLLNDAKVCPKVQLYANQQVQELYEWLSDIDYVGGNADAFRPILDNMQKDMQKGSFIITVEMVKKFMSAFESAKTLQRVQMLIGAGYQGKGDIGDVGESRERLFFGQDVRWNVLFIKDSAAMAPVVKKLIIDFRRNNNDIRSLLADYGQNAHPDTFVYYMLNYNYALWAPNNPNDSEDKAKDGLYFFAISGKLDDMDLISLKSISVQPLSAYHIDPLVCAVLHGYPDDLIKRFSFIGRFKTKRGVAISQDGDDIFEMVSTPAGWTIKTDKNGFEAKILNNNPSISYIGEVFQLSQNGAPVKDKVIIGKAVLEALATHFGWKYQQP